MKILFLTLLDFDNIDEHNIYTDLLREFKKNGHKIYVISPIEKKKKKSTYIVKENEDVTILKVKIGNIQKTNFIEKGISTLTIERCFVNGIKKYFSDVKFDLVLYSTPPITFYRAIAYIKQRDRAKTYLMLKDIFPQNAVDLDILRKTGIKGFIYRYFRRKEKKLYAVSDRIGCMSQANVDYICKHNPEISPSKIEICPNSIEVINRNITNDEIVDIRKKYEIPLNKIVFVYGGNLGRPQGIDFLIECLKTQKDNQKVFFLIIGSGTEYRKLQDFIRIEEASNVLLMQQLPREEYEQMIESCDVGMIFLDYRFTIPNFPSRILSYMQAKLPVFAVTDPNTDMGRTIVDGDFGWWCLSNDIKKFNSLIEIICKSDLKGMGKLSFEFLQKEYSVNNTYRLIERWKSKS